jgi:fructose-bisphosphate aldolase class I
MPEMAAQGGQGAGGAHEKGSLFRKHPGGGVIVAKVGQQHAQQLVAFFQPQKNRRSFAQILGHGLMPIIEPEVNIKIDDKAEAEELLLAAIQRHLETVANGQQVMLKLSLPTKANLYKPLVNDPRVMRVVALSGGYSRDEANELLSANPGVIASFSRALTEGLSHGQSDADFDATLAATIDSIFEASRAA